jgi:hypothetical protein
MAEKCVKIVPREFKSPTWNLLALGMVRYRQGEARQAELEFRAIQAVFQSGLFGNDSNCRATGAAFQAMALESLGQGEQSSRFIAEAEEEAGRNLGVVSDRDLGVYWHDVVNAKRAIEEAKTVIQSIRTVAAVLVPPTSEWRWLHPVDGRDPAEAEPDFHRRFFLADYDDSGWQTGADNEESTGGFGYGDEGFSGIDIGTPVEEGHGKNAYLRHRFTTAKEFSELELRCHRDDGIIVYLDGEEVVRNNMREGEEAYNLPAQRAVSNSDETAICRIPLKHVILPAGEHVLAISLHNSKGPSSDLRIGGITLVEVE